MHAEVVRSQEETLRQWAEQWTRTGQDGSAAMARALTQAADVALAIRTGTVPPEMTAPLPEMPQFDNLREG